MSGLIVKDINLLKSQKTTLLVMLFMIFALPVMGMGIEFTMGYTAFVFVVLITGTLSYDEFDRGMSFLMTLPVERKTYVREKYLLGIISVAFGLTLSAVVNAVMNYQELFGAGQSIAEFVGYIFGIFLAITIVWDVMLPMQIKFGAEKSRICLLFVTAVCAFVIYMGQKLIESGKANVSGLVKWLNGLSELQILSICLILAVIAFMISYRISVSIIEKKEY